MIRPLREGSLTIGFVAWRDLAHPQAGGSEVVVDRMLCGLQERGHQVRLMCGGPVEPRSYPVDDLGGAFAQYARAPITHARHLRHADVLVDVQNGIPFFSPLWRSRPSVCYVHHVHTEQWRLRFPEPIAGLGRQLESRLMPWAYRRSTYVAPTQSTAAGLRRLGVAPDAIRVIPHGVEPTVRTAGRDASPMFLALGRLVPHKRIDLLLRLWERVRPLTGGRLVIAGDGPEAAALRAQAGEGVEFRGLVSDAEKQRLLSSAWTLVHPASYEGWGIVVLEAAMVRTPTIAFDAPGVRDTIRHGRTGLLAGDEDAFVDQWVAITRDAGVRERLGVGAEAWARSLTWDGSVGRLEAVLREAAGQRWASRGPDRVPAVSG